MTVHAQHADGALRGCNVGSPSRSTRSNSSSVALPDDALCVERYEDRRPVRALLDVGDRLQVLASRRRRRDELTVGIGCTRPGPSGYSSGLASRITTPGRSSDDAHPERGADQVGDERGATSTASMRTAAATGERLAVTLEVSAPTDSRAAPVIAAESTVPVVPATNRNATVGDTAPIENVVMKDETPAPTGEPSPSVGSMPSSSRACVSSAIFGSFEISVANRSARSDEMPFPS